MGSSIRESVSAKIRDLRSLIKVVDSILRLIFWSLEIWILSLAVFGLDMVGGVWRLGLGTENEGVREKCWVFLGIFCIFFWVGGFFFLAFVSSVKGWLFLRSVS